MKWIFPRLRHRGVLGLNERGIEYIARCNSRRNFPGADDKLLTKKLAIEAGISVPGLLHFISTGSEIRSLPGILSKFESFVMKPAHGSGGEGIIVIDRVNEEGFRKTSGEMLDAETIRYHAADTLCGLYSLGGRPDEVMIEEVVRSHNVFEQVTFRGVPDIRIIVYYGVPVMAMLRLPTQRSNGRANLHQGAVGAGIRLADGMTSRGVYEDRPTDRHPDTGHLIGGLVIPGWQRILELSSRCCEFSSLFYLGVDFVIDRVRGPLMLEINARPGLAIQIANNAGLTPRLRRVDSMRSAFLTASERVDFARSAFD